MHEFKKRIATIGIAGALLVLPVAAHAQQAVSRDFYRYPLYADGSISCSGADDTSRHGGQVAIFPFHQGNTRGVYFKFKLRNVQPNRNYTIAVSEEPNCAHAVHYGTVRTDQFGNATFYGFYPASSGAHNLLFNSSTSASGLNNPRFREVGTRNAHVVVP